MDAKPIFVHSLFRSGSTYIFNAFRRSRGGYWCYQEPLNEYVRYVADAPQRLLEIDAHDGSSLRHPALDKPYFWEFYQVREAIAPLFRKAFSYDEFFMEKDHPSFGKLRAYLQSLIDYAKGRPFFQCCRTSGRLLALRDAFDGVHVHLWRNPHDQWWSYQVGDYFDATTQLILNAANLPAPLAAVKELCGIADFHDQSVDKELAHARSHRLSARDSYLAFYALWLYSFMAGERTAHLSINIDALSQSVAYRQRTLSTLASEGLDALDFSDCSVAQAQYGGVDLGFFAEGEDRAHALFQAHGVNTDAVATALDRRDRHKVLRISASANSTIAASRVREIALWQMNLVARTQRQRADREVALAETQGLVAAQRADLVAAENLATTQRGDLAGLRATLVARDEDLAGLRATLVARDEELAEAVARVSALAAELTNTKLQLAALADDLSTARARLSSLEAETATARQRSERLHDELVVAGSRLEESGREVSRWWSVADATGRHLQAIYASRSWRLTAPLREVNAWRKRALGTAGIGAATLGSLPRHAVRRVLLAAWAHAQGRPERRARFVRLLAPFPRLYARLRTFAFAHAPAMPDPIAHTGSQSLSERPASGSGICWEDLPASVWRVHQQLMEARSAASPTADQGTRTQPSN